MLKNFNEENLLCIKNLFEKIKNAKIKFEELTKDLSKEYLEHFET